MIFHESFVPRITVLEGRASCNGGSPSFIWTFIGSLDRPLFGLSQEQFGNLAASVDAIVHNGALVNWVNAVLFVLCGDCC